MPARRTYRCTDCGYQFDHLHLDSSESFAGADCPNPECTAGKTAWQPGGFSIQTDRMKAVKITQDILEQDYGLTDMNDNLRPGDTVAKGPAPIQTAEADAMVREMVQAGLPAEMGDAQKQAAQSFWQGGAPAQANPVLAGAVARGVAGGAAGAAQARAEGLDPISLLHKEKPGIKMNVVAAR